MNKKEREQIDLNLYSRSLKYIRNMLENTTFVANDNTTEDLMKQHKENCEMFEKYIEALRYDAKGDKQCVWRLKQEKELAEKKEKEYKQLYFELYNQKESDIEAKWEKICNTNIEIYKKRIESEVAVNVKIRTKEIEKELEKQKAINEKWKEMYTGQCEANRILIQKIERLENN